MADTNKPKEEQIKEMLCDKILEFGKANPNSFTVSSVKTLAEVYEIMFGKYQPEQPPLGR